MTFTIRSQVFKLSIFQCHSLTLICCDSSNFNPSFSVSAFCISSSSSLPWLKWHSITVSTKLVDPCVSQTEVEGSGPLSKSHWRQLWKDLSHSWIKPSVCTLLWFPYHCHLITGVTPQKWSNSKKNPDVLVLFLLSSAAAAAPKRKVQTTLSNLVVRGVDAIVQETKQKIGT